MVKHIYACRCGAETPASFDELRIGRVFQCPECMHVAAHVIPEVDAPGASAWVEIKKYEANFYRLLSGKKRNVRR